MNTSDTSDGDERYHITNLYTSIEGTVLCSTSFGSFSVVASIAIIVIIFRSHDGLSSVYHRFIFGMSIGNLLAAVSMSLNTLLMPSDMPYTGFEGLHFGNQTTCNIQGFIFEFGNSIEILYFVSLLRPSLTVDENEPENSEIFGKWPKFSKKRILRATRTRTRKKKFSECSENSIFSENSHKVFGGFWSSPKTF